MAHHVILFRFRATSSPIVVVGSPEYLSNAKKIRCNNNVLEAYFLKRVGTYPSLTATPLKRGQAGAVSLMQPLIYNVICSMVRQDVSPLDFLNPL